MPKQSKSSPIAIVGLSALFPGSNTAQGFWRDIVAGKDLISDIPPTRWLIEDHYDPDPKAPDKTYAKRGSFLGDIGFDPMEFGVPPSAINATDTCQLLALIVAKRVLDDALNSQFTEVPRERASVIRSYQRPGIVPGGCQPNAAPSMGKGFAGKRHSRRSSYCNLRSYF